MDVGGATRRPRRRVQLHFIVQTRSTSHHPSSINHQRITQIMSSIGPQLPPHLQASSSRPQPAQPTQPSDSDSEDDYAPALPPSLVAQRGIGPSLPPSTSSAGPSRAAGSAVGPAPPPPAYDHDEYSDSDEEVGPSLGEATRADEARSGVKEFMEREARWAKEREVSCVVIPRHVLIVLESSLDVDCSSVLGIGSCETETAQKRGMDVSSTGSR
jgi:hypothetical protein